MEEFIRVPTPMEEPVIVDEIKFKNGDFVKKEDIIAIVSSKNYKLEIEPYNDGYIEYTVDINDIVTKNSIICIIRSIPPC